MKACVPWPKISLSKPEATLTKPINAGTSMSGPMTMGCGDKCTYVHGLRRDDWPIRNPKGLTPEEVRIIRDEIKERVQSLIANFAASTVATGDLASQDLS